MLGRMAAASSNCCPEKGYGYFFWRLSNLFGVLNLQQGLKAKSCKGLARASGLRTVPTTEILRKVSPQALGIKQNKVDCIQLMSERHV